MKAKWMLKRVKRDHDYHSELEWNLVEPEGNIVGTIISQRCLDCRGGKDKYGEIFLWWFWGWDGYAGGDEDNKIDWGSSSGLAKGITDRSYARVAGDDESLEKAMKEVESLYSDEHHREEYELKGFLRSLDRSG